jgi:hypothetical protein
VRRDAARLGNNLAALNLLTVDTTKENTDVVTGLSLIKELLNISTPVTTVALGLFGKSDDRGVGVADLDNTTSSTACSNRSTTCDVKNIFNRHKERRSIGRTGSAIKESTASIKAERSAGTPDH